LGLTILELGLGHLEEAIHQAETAQAVLNELGIQDADLSPTPDLVEAYLRLGKVESARAACKVYAEQAAEKGLPWARARAERSLGLITDDTTWSNHFTGALQLHARSADSFESARTSVRVSRDFGASVSCSEQNRGLCSAAADRTDIRSLPVRRRLHARWATSRGHPSERRIWHDRQIEVLTFDARHSDGVRAPAGTGQPGAGRPANHRGRNVYIGRSGESHRDSGTHC